jgi:septum formation protein
MKNIILASLSPRRKVLLKEWGLSFKICSPNTDENFNLVRPSYIVKFLASKKAEAVVKNNPNSLVISADTIVFLNGKIVGKPRTIKESIKILRELNGSFHKVYTGAAIIYKNKKKIFYDTAKVKMKKLPENELKKLFGKHLDKAGAYSIQNKEDKFVEKIYGDYYTVVGMPYIKLKRELKNFNITLKLPSAY